MTGYPGRQVNWYVIAGPPSSGKTAVAAALAEQGYGIVPDEARTLLEEGLADGRTAQQVRRDVALFQGKVMDRKCRIAETYDPEELVFWDYGLAETVAFYRLENLDVSPALLDRVQQFRFAGVFLLEQLAWDEDAVRTEDTLIQRRLASLIREAYLELGYQLYRIPQATVAERVTMILEQTSR